VLGPEALFLSLGRSTAWRLWRAGCSVEYLDPLTLQENVKNFRILHYRELYDFHLLLWWWTKGNWDMRCMYKEWEKWKIKKKKSVVGDWTFRIVSKWLDVIIGNFVRNEFQIAYQNATRMSLLKADWRQNAVDCHWNWKKRKNLALRMTWNSTLHL